MPTIPNKLHFIWVGKAIPERYARNILSWVALNPLYAVTLWTQHHLLEENTQLLQEACKRHFLHQPDITTERSETPLGYKVENKVDEHTTVTYYVSRTEMLMPLSDPMLLAEELSEWKNYGAASDILRLWVLHQEGGIYMDTDTYHTGNSLPCNIQAPEGFLMTTNGAHGVTMIRNCIMASPQRSRIIPKLAANHAKTYRDEYKTVCTGMTNLTRAAKKRMDSVSTARAGLATADTLSPEELEEHRHAFALDFTTKTVKRLKPLLRGLSVHTDLISFEIQSGYKPIIKNEGSWRLEGKVAPLQTKTSSPSTQ